MKTCTKCGCVYDDDLKNCPSCNNNENKKNFSFFFLFLVSIFLLITKHYILFLFFLSVSMFVKTYRKPVKNFIPNKQEKALTSQFFNSLSDEFFTEDWDSIERQRKALIEYYEVLEDNGNEFIIKTESGNTYKTSLNSCTCPDFKENRKPCKHMYFAAHKLGVFNLLWGFKNTPENKKLVEILNRVPLFERSIIKINNDYLNLEHLGIVWLKKISKKLGNVEKESLFAAFPNLLNELKAIDSNISEKSNKTAINNLIAEKMPNFIDNLVENYRILDINTDEPKYRSYCIRQGELKKNRYSKNYLLD